MKFNKHSLSSSSAPCTVLAAGYRKMLKTEFLSRSSLPYSETNMEMDHLSVVSREKIEGCPRCLRSTLGTMNGGGEARRGGHENSWKR